MGLGMEKWGSLERPNQNTGCMKKYTETCNHVAQVKYVIRGRRQNTVDLKEQREIPWVKGMSGNEDREIEEDRLTKTKAYKKPYRTLLVCNLIKHYVCMYSECIDNTVQKT